MDATPTLKAALGASPLLYPLDIDAQGEFVQFVRLSEADYSAASFLDHTMLAAGQRVAPVAWAEVAAASTGLPIHCDFIFHISHVGSTLLSRLLGEHPALFSVREPTILRRLAMGKFPDRWEVFLGLWSRTFDPQQKAIIKASSFVNAIAEQLLERVDNSRAVLMYVPARTFIAAMLDGATGDIERLAAERAARLQQLVRLPPSLLHGHSAGEQVAMSWLAEMLSLQRTAERFPERTLWLDFDAFLEDTAQHLSRVLRHLGVDDDCHRLLAANTLERYAKRPEVEYNAAFRQRLLAQAHAKWAAEVARGLAWLESTLPHLPPLQG